MNSEHPKIPVEPLSDARWAKIDEAVFTALDGAAASAENPSGASPPETRRGRRAWFAAAGLVAVAAGVVLVVRGGAPPASSGLVVNPSHIATGDAPSRLAVGESTIEVAPSSAVVASGDDAHGVLVVVEKGKVECEVTPRKARPPFVVQAGNVRVRVVGTRFAVSRDAGSVHVAVTHGTVEVSRGAEVTMLHDGESWPRAELAPPVTTASSEPTPPPPAVDTGASRPVAAPTSAPSPTARPTAGPDAQKSFELAAKTEASDPDGAMATYRRLASNGGPWAPTALFAAGRLASERGRTAEAKKLLEDYLARYPQGANAEDARRILARVR